MSKATNPGVEDSITCGFFNSVATTDTDGNTISDRLYYAEQMSAIFDGIINDGVFESIGDKLMVSAATGNKVNVGTGKCWFNNTWTVNDAIFPVDCGQSDDYSPRIDAIVVEVDKRDSVRDNFIKVIQGEAQANPVKPSMETGIDRVYRYPLAYITRKAKSAEITNADIESALMSGETPFVTGIVEVTELSEFLTQWSAQLDQYIAAGENKLDVFINKETDDYNDWRDTMTLAMENIKQKLLAWSVGEETMIMNWFDEVKGKLSEDPALNLQIQIDADEVERYLIEGLPDGTKKISDDGTVIRTVDSQGRELTKTFTDNFLTITSVLKSRVDTEYLPYPYASVESGKTVIVSNVTFTDNGDGTVTANGTASADIYFILSTSTFTLDPDTYSLSGCPVGGSEETYYFGADLYNGNTYVSNSTVKDIGNGTTLDLTDKTYTKVSVFIGIKSGVTVNNLIFNPKVLTTGIELGRLVKKISEDGKTITSTLSNYSDAVPNLVEIERGVDAIIASENSYIGGDDA